MLTGVLVPTSGEIHVHNLVPYKQRIDNNRNIDVVFGQRSQLWWDLPVLRLLGDIYEVPKATFTDDVLQVTRQFIQTQAETWSILAASPNTSTSVFIN
jgi:ABC-type uncharacterized transport system ATPase subunit